MGAMVEGFFFFLGGLWWWVDVASGGGFFFLFFFAMVCDVGWMWLVEVMVGFCWLWHGW